MSPQTHKTSLSGYLFPVVLLLYAIFQMAYFIPDRAEIIPVWLNFALAFIAYFSILHRFNTDDKIQLNYGLAIAARLVLIFSFPLLSDDIYRFIWDGSLIIHHINPFSYTPQQLMEMKLNWLDPVLFQKMNSPTYFSVYPPINQLAFWLCALPGKGNLLASAVILRLFILPFELGNIYLIKKLLRFYQKDEKLVFLYALNPLVILEFTGNLHFEAVIIFFSLWMIWFLIHKKWIKASLALALGIGAKLLPVLFLPFFIRYIGWKKSIYAGIIVGLSTILMFLPFIYNLDLAQHFIESIRLYYGKFEFNGSIYQILKAIGWKYYGYNPIAKTSKLLIVLTSAGFTLSYIKSKNIFSGIFWLMFTYVLFGAIVHPWYILILVALSPFVKWRFAVVWSVLICLSYYTYRVFPYQESMTLVWVEYGLLAAFMVYEWLNKSSKKENSNHLS